MQKKIALVSKNKHTASEEYQQKLERLKKGITEDLDSDVRNEPLSKPSMTQRRPNSAAITSNPIAKVKPEKQNFKGTNDYTLTSAIISQHKDKQSKEIITQIKPSLNESSSQNDSSNQIIREKKPASGANTVKLMSEANKLNSDIYELIERSRKMAQETRKLFLDSDTKLTQSREDVHFPVEKITTINTTISRGSVIEKIPIKKDNPDKSKDHQPLKFINQKRLITDSSTMEKEAKLDCDEICAKIPEPDKADDISLDDIIQTFDKLHNPPVDDEKPSFLFQPTKEIVKVSKYSVNQLPKADLSSENNKDLFENFEQVEREIRSQFNKPNEHPKPIINNSILKPAKNIPNSLDFDDDDVINKFEDLKRLIDSTKTDIKGIGTVQNHQPVKLVAPVPVKRVSFRDELPNNPPKTIISEEPEERVQVLEKAPFKRLIETKKTVKNSRDSDDLFSLNLFNNLK